VGGESSLSGTLAVIALGSNLGDRRGHLQWAVERLSAHLPDLRLSSIIETDPVGVDQPQPPYLNAVVAGHTGLDAEQLLIVLLGLERQRGRLRPSARAPRTLDLDLILFGDEVIETDSLVVPHPRFRQRAFVLKPLAELLPEVVDPVTGRSALELLEKLPDNIIRE
jgi:2-amino-4-hydroxy-6-hydroxymethyldihydropteridine diphosphokinase